MPMALIHRFSRPFLPKFYCRLSCPRIHFGIFQPPMELERILLDQFREGKSVPQRSPFAASRKLLAKQYTLVKIREAVVNPEFPLLCAGAEALYLNFFLWFAAGKARENENSPLTLAVLRAGAWTAGLLTTR